MMRKLMIGAAVSALMVSGALAQAPKPPSNSTSSPPAHAQPSGGKADVVTSQKPDQWLASKFKGTDVMGADNKKIGDVADILFDKQGKIEAYVISIGGFLGMGGKEIALAPSSFEVIKGSNGKPDVLKLSLNQNELKQAQNFKPYERPRPVTTGSGAVGGMPGGARPSPSPMAPKAK
jgi:sporulation protein YlmC with PRC-barrel domain